MNDSTANLASMFTELNPTARYDGTQITVEEDPGHLIYPEGYSYDGGFLVDESKSRENCTKYHPKEYYLIPITVIS